MGRHISPTRCTLPTSTGTQALFSLEELQVIHGVTGTRLVELDAENLDERARHPGAEADRRSGLPLDGDVLRFP